MADLVLVHESTQLQERPSAYNVNKLVMAPHAGGSAPVIRLWVRVLRAHAAFSELWRLLVAVRDAPAGIHRDATTNRAIGNEHNIVTLQAITLGASRHPQGRRYGTRTLASTNSIVVNCGCLDVSQMQLSQTASRVGRPHTMMLKWMGMLGILT
jgi:hypothetical protein